MSPVYEFSEPSPDINSTLETFLECSCWESEIDRMIDQWTNIARKGHSSSQFTEQNDPSARVE